MRTNGNRPGFVSVKGARQHNLKNVDVEIPRDALVVFTGVSGSGKSSLAFGTLYAEAQRRYLESVAPYARRLFDQMGIPDVDSIDGLPPAVALQQQRGAGTTRSSVGSVTTLSNLLRMLYSRAGDYPKGQPELHGEEFSTNSPEGACPNCHGIGRIYEATEKTMVPDDSLTIRERAIAAWPTAWGGQNQRDILVTLGYDVDRPWRELPKKDRDWILFTEEHPTVPVYPGLTPEETRRAVERKAEANYQGTFTGVRRYLLHTLAHTESALTRKRTMQFLIAAECSVCHGKRLRPEALAVKFAGLDIAEISALPLSRLDDLIRSTAVDSASGRTSEHPERALVAQRITEDLVERIRVMLDLGLGYLSLERSTPTLSPGELQRLRLATQIRSNLFGVVYVLDEPSAGLHPADTEALLVALDRLKASGNSLFVVEHELDVIRHADWIVDVGRFGSADPYSASAGPGDPGSWNRYSYSRGEPVGRRDILGLADWSIDVEDDDPGEPAQIHTSEPSKSFMSSLSRLERAQDALGSRKAFSQDCEKDIAKLGFTPSLVASTAADLNVEDGTVSQLPVSYLFGTATQAGAAFQKQQDELYSPGQTIADYFGHNPKGLTAATVLSGGEVYINPKLIGTSITTNASLLFHEALHALGLVDTTIQELLGITVDGNNTRNISDKLSKDCFSGKGNF